MIDFIQGTVESIQLDTVVIDHNGLGFRIHYPHPEQIHLNADIKIYTWLHYTETDFDLYGFASRDEQDLFLRLISVKGLGPKTALNMLAKKNVNEIISAIESGNVTTLKGMPGIGAKTASQIVLDLKGKLVEAEHPVANTKAVAQKYSSSIMEAMSGLSNLGYKPQDVNRAAEYLSKQPEMKTEEYLRLGLQYLRQK